jgi:hypothetical protein
VTSGRVRALTRNPRKLEAICKGALPAIIKEMELHLEAGVEYLSIDHHKLDSKYQPTYRYQESWVASPVAETSSGLLGTLSNEVADEDGAGRPYAIYVAGSETERSPQAGSWVGPWNQLVDALRAAGTGTTFRQRITKAIHRALEAS